PTGIKAGVVQKSKQKNQYTPPQYRTVEEFAQDIETSAGVIGNDFDRQTGNRAIILGERAAKGDTGAAVQAQQLEEQKSMLGTTEGITAYRSQRMNEIDEEIKRIEEVP